MSTAPMGPYELSKLQPCVLHSQLSSLVYPLFIPCLFFIIVNVFAECLRNVCGGGAQPACELHFFVSWKVHNLQHLFSSYPAHLTLILTHGNITQKFTNF